MASNSAVSNNTPPNNVPLHSCIMCRDFSQLDEFAWNMGLLYIEKSEFPKYSGQKKILVPLLKQITSSELSMRIKTLQTKLADLEDPHASIGMTPEQIKARLRAADGTRAQLQSVMPDDMTNVGDFAFQLFQLACDIGLLQDPSDHIGRARLMCTWLAASMQYVYSTETLAAPASTGDLLRSGNAFCLGYATAFADLFNAVTKRVNASASAKRTQAQMSDKYLARCIKGTIKQTSRKAKPDEFSKPGDKPKTRFDPKDTSEWWALCTPSEGHAWAAFPSAVNSNGDPSQWKIVDPCWIQGGWQPAEIATNGVASQWFCDSTQIFQRTHRADKPEDRILPTFTGVGVDEGMEEFRVKDLAPSQPYTDLQIEESTLHPQSYQLDPKETQSFTFTRNCPGSRKLPSTAYFVPVKGGIRSFSDAQPFRTPDLQVGNPILQPIDTSGGPVTKPATFTVGPPTYTASFNTLALAKAFKGTDLKLEIGYPCDTNGKLLDVADTKGNLSAVAFWKVVAVYQINK